MSSNADTIRRFYEAFQRRDHSAMAACYHPDIHFSDPVFQELHGDEARAMWHMLCEQGTDLTVTFGDVAEEGDRGSTRWEATYTFSPTGRKVHNRVTASFTFADGLIRRHVDDFDLWRWTRMAVGLPGLIAGWTPSAKAKVRDMANSSLDRFLVDHPSYRRPDDDGLGGASS
jgi:ketosteroid isomerase-like protein